MSKSKKNKKLSAEVEAITKKSANANTQNKTARASRTSSLTQEPVIFGKQNYTLMLAGIGLIIIGMFLMMGGHMPSPDVWDESLIYSFRRTVLAPFVILVGLGIQFFAIFKK